MAVAENIDLIALIDGMLPDFHAASVATLDFWTQQDLLDWADEGVKRLAKEAACWVERYTDITTANATRAYPLAARHIATLQVSYGTNPLRPASAAELEAKDSAYQTTAATADTPPSHWYEDLQRAEYVSVVPVPIAAVNLPIIQTIYPEPVGGDFSVGEYPARVFTQTVGPTYGYDYDGTLTEIAGGTPWTNPVALDPTYEGYDAGSNANRGQWGFEYGDALYVFGVNGNVGVENTNRKIRAMKSTDGGATWAEMDADNAPAAITRLNTFGWAYTAMVDGTNVRLLSWDGSIVESVLTFAGLVPSVFSLSTDTWSSAPAASFAEPVVYPKYRGGADADTREVMFQLLRRGTNNHLLFYSGPTVNHSGTGNKLGRAYYATYNGNVTWGTPTALPGQTGDLYYAPVTAVQDTVNNRTHFFYLRSGSSQTLLHVSMDAEGNFGTVQEVVTDINGSFNSNLVSDPIIAGGKLWIAVWEDSGTSADINVYHANLAQNPTWASSTVVSDSGYDIVTVSTAAWIGQFIGLAYYDGDLMVSWAFSDQDAAQESSYIGHWRYSTADATALTWSAPATLFETPARTPSVSIDGFQAQVLYPFPMASGIGCLMVSLDSKNTVDEIAQFFKYGVTPASNTVDQFYLSGIEAGQVVNITFSGTAATITLMNNLVDRTVYATYANTASLAWTVPEGVTSAWLEVSVTN